MSDNVGPALDTVTNQNAMKMTLSDFVKYVFDRRVGEVAWYAERDHEDLGLTNVEFMAFARQVFSGIGIVHKSFSEAQVAVGLRYLIDPFGGIGYAYLDALVPERDRIETVKSMMSVFERLFAGVCVDKLPVSKADSKVSPYSYLCFMWWDIFPRHGVPRDDAMKSLDLAILQTIEAILLIENTACQESALHGLSHWWPAEAEIVEAAIDKFLPRALPNLLPLAEAARNGNIP